MMHDDQAQPRIYVTTHDYERLSALAECYPARRRGVLVDFPIEELEYQPETHGLDLDRAPAVPA